MEGYFFHIKFFEILLLDRQLYYFRVLGIYGDENFSIHPKLLNFRVLGEMRKNFSQKFNEIPQQTRCNFPI